MTGLNTNQAAFLAQLLVSKTATEAAAAVGLTDRTARRYMADPVFIAALREQQAAILAGVRAAIVGNADHVIATLRGLLDDANDATRARVGTWWLDYLQKAIEAADLDERLAKLEVMTNDGKNQDS